jgi:hypothetical protein
VLCCLSLKGQEPVDTQAPRIESTYPANLQEDVPTNTNITIRFDEAVDLESAQGSLLVIPHVWGSFSWNQEEEMTFHPSEPLWPCMRYMVIVQPTVRDKTGNEIRSFYTFNFETT